MSKDKYPPTPTLERLQKIAPFSQKIGEFLEWLECERKLTLAQHHEHSDGCYNLGEGTLVFREHVDQEILAGRMVWDYNAKSAFETRKIVTRKEYKEGRFKSPQCGCHDGQLLPAHVSVDTLLHEFFEIDPNKEEAERRAVLDHIRKQNVIQSTINTTPKNIQ